MMVRPQTAWILFLAMVASVYVAMPSRAEEQKQAVNAARSRTIVVALDGSGEYRSIQEAVDAAGRGDTVRVKDGSYKEDVTIHSKEGLRLIGEGIDRVTVLGLNRVGAFHIGKWPYGATNIEISGITIQEHGGLAMGIFNGQGIVLRDVRINGLVFGQQVQNVRIEECLIGGSETTGVQFADSQAVLSGNVIHHNDHGVTVAGKSDVRLERNVITQNLYEGVMVTDSARAVLLNNTIVKNGGGLAFLDVSRGEAVGNIVGLNKVGFVIGPSSHLRLSYNALSNSEHDYLRAGTPNRPAPELKTETDVAADPRFVDSGRGDFRLLPDSPLLRVGQFAYLGALPPLDAKATLPHATPSR
ncbi:MAG: pectinesterase family protein [Nitrospiraceae bacterium]